VNVIQIFLVFVQLTFFGIFIAFNPLLLMSELAIIIKSKRPLLYATVLVLGVATPLVLIAIIGSIFFDDSTSIEAFHINIEVSPLLNIILGATFLGVALRISTAKEPVKQKPLSADKLALKPLFIFAFFRSALSFTSIIGIVAATKVLKDLTDNYALVLIGLLWTICIGMLPFVSMIGYSVKRPETVKTIQDKVDPLMNRSFRPIIIWGCVILGGFQIAVGVTKLITS
jgi:hypothetical protein